MRIFLYLLFIVGSTNALSCGTALKRFMGYWRENGLETKEQYLDKISYKVLTGYSPLDTDPIITKVLLDAIEIGVSRTVIEKVLQNYNCVYSSNSTKEYLKIKKFIGNKKYYTFCDIPKIDTMYIVTSNGGATIRESATKQSARLNAISEGSTVIVKKIENNWADVDSYAGSGFVYLPLLKKY